MPIHKLSQAPRTKVARPNGTGPTHRATASGWVSRFLPAVVLAGAALYYLSYIRYGVNLTDEGVALLGADAILKGKVLYRDFWVPYMPGRYFLYALFFRLFGAGVIQGRVLGLVARLCSVALAIRLGRRILPPALAVLPAILMTLVPGPWHKSLFVMLSLANAAVAVWYTDRPGTKRLIACGAAAGITMIYRSWLGYVAIGTLSVAVLLAEASPLSERGQSIRAAVAAWIAKTAVLLIVAAVVVAPVFLYFHAQDALGDLLQRAPLGALRYNLARWKGFPSLVCLSGATEQKYGGFIGIVGHDLYALLYYLPPLVYAVALVTLGRRALRRRLDAEARTALILTVSGILVYGIVCIFAHPTNLLVALPLGYVVCTYVGYKGICACEHPRLRNARPWALIVAASVLIYVLTSLLVLAIGWPNPNNIGAIGLRWSNPAYLDLPRAGVYGTACEVEGIAGIVAYIQARTRPDDTVLLIPREAWMVNFLCERFSPLQCSILFTGGKRQPAKEQLIIRDLGAQRTPYIVVWEDLSKNPVLALPDSEIMRYIVENYQEEARFGQYTVLGLKP